MTLMPTASMAPPASLLNVVVTKSRSTFPSMMLEA